MTTYLGYAAAFFTTFSFLPQAVKTIKTKDTSSISLIMYLMFVTGVFLWLIYGLFIKDLPIIVANAITLVLAASILKIKLDSIKSERARKKAEKTEKA